MGNSSNILIQKSGVSYMWLVHFVSSHNLYYFKDLSNNYLFLNKYLLVFFKKNFFKFYLRGLFFSHIKIYYLNANFFNVKIFFFDLFYLKMFKFFLYLLSLRKQRRKLFFKYKYNRVLHFHDFFHLRYKKLEYFMKFYTKFKKFNLSENNFVLKPYFMFMKYKYSFFFFKNLKLNFLNFINLKSSFFKKKKIS